jgi:hypothetical protein
MMFSVFFNCVYQLVYHNPDFFEFSEEFLLFVYDEFFLSKAAYISALSGAEPILKGFATRIEENREKFRLKRHANPSSSVLDWSLPDLENLAPAAFPGKSTTTPPKSTSPTFTQSSPASILTTKITQKIDVRRAFFSTSSPESQNRTMGKLPTSIRVLSKAYTESTPPPQPSLKQNEFPMIPWFKFFLRGNWLMMKRRHALANVVCLV